MIIMAQHPHQQSQHSTAKAVQIKQQQQHEQQQQQLEQDGKRTLIKNQLYLIEQLQLENANLRNERDILHLENEELRFQLQMISSSNILSQSGATFNEQRLEPLVESSDKITTATSHNHNRQADTAQPGGQLSSESNSRAVKILATPIRQPQHVTLSSSAQTAGENKTLVRKEQQMPTSIPAGQLGKLIAGKSSSLTAFNIGARPTSQLQTMIAPQSRTLPQDDEERRVRLVEQQYGDGEYVQAAAVVIQRAFRKYQICKRFRTITAQLRLTHQASSTSVVSAGSQQPSKRDDGPRSKSCIPPPPSESTSVAFASGTTRAAAWESLSQAASRLAASAAANSKSTQPTSALPIKPVHSSQQQQQQQLGKLQSLVESGRPLVNKRDPVMAAAINFQQLESIRKRHYRVGLNIFNKNPEKGISFIIAHSFIDSSSPYTNSSLSSYYQSNQLHLIDKEQLVANGGDQQHLLHLPGCQLCREEENLKRNVAHFLLHRKGLAREKIGVYFGNLQSQFNQDVLQYYLQELDFNGLQIDIALRKFLSTFRLPGEAQKIERIVDCFAQRYVHCQQSQSALVGGNPSAPGVTNNTTVPPQNGTTTNSTSNHQSHQSAPGIQSNGTAIPQPQKGNNNLILLSKDEIFILTFAIIMLNTDLHSPSLKPTSRMSASQFVNNLRGVFKSQSINESDLIEIYERVKANQISTTPDHVSHVMKVQQGLTATNFQRKELPNLCVPQRRLVCFCRLFEVYDVNKKERVGQHQREIFLFNDLLLVTKLARRVRANTTQLCTYRQSISLQGLYVRLFQTTHYHFGIRLCQKSNDETLIMFNARNELDQSRFVDDLGESIAEMDEMERIKTHNIIETIHFKFLERLRRHLAMHNANGNGEGRNSGANKNGKPDVNYKNGANSRAESNDQLAAMSDDNQQARLANDNCDITNETTTKIDEYIGKHSHEEEEEEERWPETRFDCGAQEKTMVMARNVKSSSMLNLSSMSSCGFACGKTDHLDSSSGDSSEAHMSDKTTIRQNRSFVMEQQPQQRRQQQPMQIESGVNQNQPKSTSSIISGSTNEQQSKQQVGGVSSASLNSVQRRCSASSVHSLDSGLFLSRDVSPNQSS